MKTFREYTPNQQFLLPPSLLDWVPEDHPAHFINDVVGVLDLSMIYADYDEGRGRPPYHPEMMLKIWLYAYFLGVRSSRRVARAVENEIGFRFLTANQLPQYWALNAFRTRHRAALSELFVQTVELAQKAGLVKLKQVAIDGTKLKANASKSKAMSYKRMDEEEERLRKEVDQFLEECDEVDRQEDAKYGESRGDELPEDLRTARKRLETIRKAKAELEEEARQRAREEQDARRDQAQKEGRPFRPRKSPDEAKPKAKAQRNFTDAESRIMKSPDSSFVQAYNGQAAVDADSQIVVAGDLTNQGNDAPHLASMLDQTCANTGATPQEVTADAGYWSEANVTAVEAIGAEAFIPPDKIPHRFWREAKPPRGRIPKDATTADLMRRKLQTQRGRERYRLRQMTVEPVFGQIKEGRSLRQFLHRGLDKARAMWRFDLAVHNLCKMYRAGVRFEGAT